MSQTYSITLFADTRILSSNNPGAPQFASVIPHGFIGFNTPDKVSEYYGFGPAQGSTPVGVGAITSQVAGGLLHEWDYALTIDVNKVQFDAIYTKHTQLLLQPPAYVFPVYDCVNGYIKDLLFAGAQADPANSGKLLGITAALSTPVYGAIPQFLDLTLHTYSALGLGQGTTRASELPGFNTNPNLSIPDARFNGGISPGLMPIPVMGSDGKISGFTFEAPVASSSLTDGGTRYTFLSGASYDDYTAAVSGPVGQPVNVFAYPQIWNIPNLDGGTTKFLLDSKSGSSILKSLDLFGNELSSNKFFFDYGGIDSGSSGGAQVPTGYTHETYQNGVKTGTTVQQIINGKVVNVSFGGDGKISSVNSINNQAPTDPVMAAQELTKLGVTQDMLTTGTTGDMQQKISTVVSSFDATHPTGAQTLLNAIGQYGGTLIDALTLVKAIQSGDPLPVTVSGLRLANDLTSTNGVPASYSLSCAANVGSGILSIMSLDAALRRGDTLGAITAGAQTLSFGAKAYMDFATASPYSITTEVSNSIYSSLNAPMFDGLPGSSPLAALNLVNSISQGDEVGTAINTLAIAVPEIGVPLSIAYTVFNIVSSLFGGSDAPPEAWGNANATWSGFNAVANSTGAYGGLETATQTYNGVLTYLDQLAAQAEAVNPGSAIGIVANRMPSLTYRNYTGYGITDIDPLTGEQRNPGVLYDLTGRPYNAPAGSVQASQSLSERMIRVALERGAIAPMWEVETAALQTQAGDPMAGLTEEERAGRAGMLAPSPQPSPASGGGSQIFRPVALDLNGDGVQTTGAARTVAFNVDDSGYLKNTAWLNNSDGFLFLDRNLNGQIDGGKELFSNSTVALSGRGLNGMRWVDSNYDGSLSALDPVWNELKVWQDANGNGAADAGETKTLAQLSITSLNYAMGTFERNGQISELSSPDLVADTEGTITYTVPEGIIVQTSNGQISLLATRIDDRSAIQANRDGVTSYEDTELIISAADLLANDTLAGLAGQNLSLTGVSGFTHGTGFLDGNGFVHYTPDANYFGAANDSEWFCERRAA